jgi:RNA polymerase sigma-70 factor (TIGR02960 family)
VSENALSRARAGDENAFQELIDQYRGELQLHCYRILGSLQDAEDQLQETLLAAWRGLQGFEERASLRTWLYRIATNRCLNALRDRRRHPQEVSSMVEPPEPTRRSEPIWLEPYPDALLEGVADTAPGPEARYETRESVGLAFVAALQHLPPRQRAALVLRDVLGYQTAEVAEMLDSSDASVKGALQRARATVDERLPVGDREGAQLPRAAIEHELVGRSSAATRKASSPCSPTRLGSPCRPNRTSTKAGGRSPGSCTSAKPVAARPSGWCPPAPTTNPPSAATSPTHRRR